MLSVFIIMQNKNWRSRERTSVAVEGGWRDTKDLKALGFFLLGVKTELSLFLIREEKMGNVRKMEPSKGEEKIAQKESTYIKNHNKYKWRELVTGCRVGFSNTWL